MTGERALIAAILLDGLRTARGFLAYTAGASGALLEARRERCRVEALEWIGSDAVSPFSFRWCCDAVGLDHVVVREGFEMVPRTFDRRRHGKGAFARYRVGGVAA